MDRIQCKHNPGVGCSDPSKCAVCGWNPAEARRRLEAQKAALLQGMKPRTTYFDLITASPEALAEFLTSIRTLDAPWDEVFQQKFCTRCRASGCDRCPHQAERNSPAWFLAQEVADGGNDPLR